MVSNFQKKYQELDKEKDKEKDIQIKNKQLEIAKNLLNNNVDIDIIMSSTGLSKEEIEKLIN